MTCELLAAMSSRIAVAIVGGDVGTLDVDDDEVVVAQSQGRPLELHVEVGAEVERRRQPARLAGERVRVVRYGVDLFVDISEHHVGVGSGQQIGDRLRDSDRLDAAPKLVRVPGSCLPVVTDQRQGLRGRANLHAGRQTTRLQHQAGSGIGHARQIQHMDMRLARRRVHFDVVDASVRGGADLRDGRPLGIWVVCDRRRHVDDDNAGSGAWVLERTNVGKAIVRPHIGIIAIDDPGERISTDDLEAVVRVLRNMAVVWTVVGQPHA